MEQHLSKILEYNCYHTIHQFNGYLKKFLQFLINIMKRPKFSFADPNFEQQSSDEQQYIQGSSLRQYNKEYSFIIRKAEQFFRDCKTCIEKFVALNQFGVGLNLNHLMSVFSKMETSIGNNNNKSNAKQQIKQQYQLSFHQVLEEMQKCIKNMLQYERTFKMQYFGQIKRSNSLTYSQKNQSPIRNLQNKSNKQSNQKKMLKSPSSYSLLKEPQENYQIDDYKIRQILTQKLNPKKNQSQPIFNTEKTYDENLLTFNIKVDKMIESIQCTRKKQETIIKIFNDNRFENTLQSRKSKIDSNYKNKKQEVLNKARMILKEDYFDYPTAANSQYP